MRKPKYFLVINPECSDLLYKFTGNNLTTKLTKNGSLFKDYDCYTKRDFEEAIEKGYIKPITKEEAALIL